MNNFERGAEWRQWDLHLHTRSSYDYKYNADDADILLCNKLKNEKISAVAITDHFIIDKSRIENLRKLAPEITFFPAVELRTDKGGTNTHIILIFDSEIDLARLENEFKVKMFDDTNKRKGNNTNESHYWDFKDIIDFARERNAIITIHAGRKSNGLDDQINNSLEVNEAIKEEIANNINIFEMGQFRDIAEYENNVLPTIGEKAMIMCSDNHNPNEYLRKAKLWIKADTTFKGLQYAISDYKNRIFIGDNPPKMKLISDNQTKYIKSIKIEKINESKTNDIWFDNELKLNYDLVAIIGNKGNGKSALADIIAFTANHTTDNFSFLNKNKFKNSKSKLAENFKSIITWESDKKDEKLLSDNIDITKLESVKYIPQSHLENVCNDLIDGKKNPFVVELNKVIFSHIPEADRLGYHNIEELIEATTYLKKNEKNKLIEELKVINKDIAMYYAKVSPENIKYNLEKLNQKKEELAVLTKQKPQEVLKPENSDEIKEEQEKLLTEINNLNTEKKKLINESDVLIQKYATTKITIQQMHNIIDETNFMKKDIEEFKNRIENTIIATGLDIKLKDILECKINTTSLENKLKELSEQQENTSKKLNKEQKDSITFQINEIDEKLKNIFEQLDAPNQKYNRYELELKEWSAKISNINGNIDKVDTILYYEEELKKVEKEYINKRVKLEKRRIQLLEGIYNNVVDEIKILKSYYNAVQAFIDNNEIINRKIKLKFDVIITQSDFKENFLKFISLGKSGTYYKNETKIDELLEVTVFNTLDGIKIFIENLMESLNYNLNNNPKTETFISSQLKDVEKLNEVLDYIFSLEYLNVQYELKSGDKSLNELSPR